MYDNTIEEEITKHDQALLDIIEAGNDLTEKQAEDILHHGFSIYPKSYHQVFDLSSITVYCA